MTVFGSGGWLSRLGSACVSAVALFFGAAAFGKFLDLGAFHAGLEGWALLPSELRPAVTVLVPTAELLLSVEWLLGLSRKVAPLAMLLLLIVLSAAFGVHVWLAVPPDCNCLGKLVAFRGEMSRSESVLIRNGLLAALLGWGLWARHRTHLEPPTPRFARKPESTATPRGATIIETLLVIAIVAILISLSVPLLGSARDAARDLRARSDLRQHLSVFTAYAGDFDGTHPFFANPKASLTVVRSSQGAVSFSYFSSGTFWPHALVDVYYDGIGLESEIFRSPYVREEEAYDTVYAYSCSMIASPLYWDLETRTGRDQLVVTRAHEVRYPSQKAVLSIDRWYFQWGGDVLHRSDVASAVSVLAASDGSVRARKLAALGETVPSGDGDPPGFDVGGHPSGWVPSGAHTLHGVLGRDLP